MSEPEDIQKVLDATALWVIETLQRMEQKAQLVDPGHPHGYEHILTAVEEAITERLDQGHWRPTTE